MERRDAEEFHKLFLESLDDIVRGVLGELPLEAIYYSLEKNYGIRREEIPEKPADFQTALVGLLGAGAPVIIRLIVRNLYGKLKVSDYQRDEHDLRRHVEICKQIHMERKGIAKGDRLDGTA